MQGVYTRKVRCKVSIASNELRTNEQIKYQSDGCKRNVALSVIAHQQTKPNNNFHIYVRIITLE